MCKKKAKDVVMVKSPPKMVIDKFPKSINKAVRYYCKHMSVPKNWTHEDIVQFKVYLAELLCYDVYNADPKAGKMELFNDLRVYASYVNVLLYVDTRHRLASTCFVA